MNLNTIKKMVEKGVQGSAEKQLKIFNKSKQTRQIFKDIASKASRK